MLLARVLPFWLDPIADPAVDSTLRRHATWKQGSMYFRIALQIRRFCFVIPAGAVEHHAELVAGSSEDFAGCPRSSLACALRGSRLHSKPMATPFSDSLAASSVPEHSKKGSQILIKSLAAQDMPRDSWSRSRMPRRF